MYIIYIYEHTREWTPVLQQRGFEPLLSIIQSAFFPSSTVFLLYALHMYIQRAHFNSVAAAARARGIHIAAATRLFHTSYTNTEREREREMGMERDSDGDDGYGEAHRE